MKRENKSSLNKIKNVYNKDARFLKKHLNYCTI